jgi:SAM-dependent methyltransferase
MPAENGMQQRGESFGHVADDYERLRPEYPAEVFDEVMSAAGERVATGVLEIGAGGGRATLPLAQRGVDLVAVEPSTDMVRVMRARLRDEAPNGTVTIREQSFDELTAADGPFGIAIAAQSFHWTDPATRWSRLADLLSADGVAALFWNEWALDAQAHDSDLVRATYARFGADLVPDLDDVPDGHEETTWVEDEIGNEPPLSPVAKKVFPWSRVLRVDDYLGLLSTTSQYVVASPTTRMTLFGALRQALGAEVHLAGRTVLLTTHRLDRF